MYFTEYKPSDSGHKCEVGACERLGRFRVITTDGELWYCGACLACIVETANRAMLMYERASAAHG